MSPRPAQRFTAASRPVTTRGFRASTPVNVRGVRTFGGPFAPRQAVVMVPAFLHPHPRPIIIVRPVRPYPYQPFGTGPGCVPCQPGGPVVPPPPPIDPGTQDPNPVDPNTDPGTADPNTDPTSGGDPTTDPANPDDPSDGTTDPNG